MKSKNNERVHLTNEEWTIQNFIIEDKYKIDFNFPLTANVANAVTEKNKEITLNRILNMIIEKSNKGESDLLFEYYQTKLISEYTITELKHLGYIFVERPDAIINIKW